LFLNRLTHQLDAHKPVLDYARAVMNFFAVTVLLAISVFEALQEIEKISMMWRFAVLNCILFIFLLASWMWIVCQRLTEALVLDLICNDKEPHVAARILAALTALLISVGAGGVVAFAALNALGIVPVGLPKA
jgi:flagellar biosynthesis protein FliQ